MCGRFTLVTPRERLVSHFRLEHACELSPRYNVAPNQAVAAVRQSPAQGRELVMLRWGLIPYWVEGLRGRYGMINARAETLAQKTCVSCGVRAPPLSHSGRRLLRMENRARSQTAVRHTEKGP